MARRERENEDLRVRLAGAAEQAAQAAEVSQLREEVRDDY